MRNLKRALSLTLASVMLLGMMVVGSSAAGYPDVAEDDNVEAIEVVQSVGVMVGDENSNFRPGDSVSRAEMAVVMGKLLNLDYNYYSATCPFTDVSGVYDWARGWVGAAAANGIVSGRGDGIYDPAATVTAVEAASMMMRALGYFKYQNDYADGFEVSTVRLGTTIGIFDGVGSSATEPMTRNQVAQMVLNALQSAVVEPDGNTINLTTPDGVVYTGKVNYVSVTSAKSFATAISRTQATSVGSQNDGWIVELGERLYDGDLKLTDHTIDAFGRPSRYWEYKGNAIGTYAKKELMVESYNVAVTGRQAYDLLGTTAINDKELLVFVDGAENSTLPANDQISRNDLRRSNTDDLHNTDRGAVTEFYVDNTYDEITIAVINNYLAEAQTDYNATSEDIRMDVYYGVTNNNPNGAADPAALTYPVTVEVEDYAMIEGLESEDLVRITMAAPDHVYNAQYYNYSIESINEMEVVADVTLSDYSAGNKAYENTPFRKLSNVTADGTRYNAAVKAIHDEDLFFQYSADVESQLRDATYNLYLDQFGNILGIKQVEKADNYIFVVGYDQGSSVLAQAIDQALIIHTDGTMETVRIDDSKLKVWDRTGGIGGTAGAWVDANLNKLVSVGSDGDDPSVNAWFTYSVKADGTYVLERMVDRQGVQNRGAGETWYIDNMHGSLTTAFTTTGNVPGSGDNYLSTGHDMPIGSNGIAYGNDDSVYITVDADRTVDAGGSIVKVNSITTGLRNVSIRPSDVTTYTGIEYNTFFIYNSRGFITYAVVIGTNGANGYEYIYLDSAITRTTDDKGDRYLYTFEGIRNNELTTFQSEVPQAFTSSAANGVLTKTSASAVVTPVQGDLIRAAVGADGIITEMVILPETRTSEMNPERNADYGYTFKVDYNTVDYNSAVAGQQNNSKDVDSRNIRSLRTNGNTLWVVTEATEDNYTLLEPDVVFFVRNPSGSSQHFTMYNNGSSAVNAVNATVNDNRGYISQVATVNDAVTGYAKTVVVDVVYTTGTNTNPSAPAGAPVDRINGSTIEINLIDETATSVSNAMIQNRVRALLTANGYTLDLYGQMQLMALAGAGTASATVNMTGGVIAKDRNGNDAFFNVVYNNWYSITVDNVVRDYVLYNGGTSITNADMVTYGANKGTGYIMATSKAANATYTYTVYPASNNTALVASGVTSPRVIRTGYVSLTGASLDSGNSTLNNMATVGTLVNTDGTALGNYAAVGTTLTLPMTITGGAHIVGVDVAVKGSVTGTTSWTVADITAAGAVKNINVTVGNSDVDANSFTVEIKNQQNTAPTAAPIPSSAVNMGDDAKPAMPTGEPAAGKTPKEHLRENATQELKDWYRRYINNFKLKPNGAYLFDQNLIEAQLVVNNGESMDWSNCLAFLFADASNGNAATNYSVIIRDASGNIVLVATASISDTAKHFIWLDQTDFGNNRDSNIGGGGVPNANTPNALVHGNVYTYEIAKGVTTVTYADDGGITIAGTTNAIASGAFTAQISNSTTPYDNP